MTRPASRGRSAGFTLLELLLAIIILATLLAALTGVLASTFRARERVNTIIDESLARSLVIHGIERDLVHMVVPAGTLAGPMLGESEGEMGGKRSDRLEFYTASGELEDGEPWGDVRKVEYHLEQPEDAAESEGAALMRAVTLNLLPSTEEEPGGDVVLRNASGLTIQYFDGDTWLDSWDSTALDNAPPQAVSMRIDFQPEQEGQAAARPLEIVCEIVAQPVSTDAQGGVAS